MRIFLPLVLTLCSIHLTEADLPTVDELLNDVMNNVSTDYVQCAAYYAHVASAVKNGGDQQTSDSYVNIYEEVITLAVVAAQTGRSEEMALKVTMARLNVVMDAMQSEIENNYSNLALLVDKYQGRCEFVVNNTEEFVEEWHEKINAKYGIE